MSKRSCGESETVCRGDAGRESERESNVCFHSSAARRPRKKGLKLFEMQ